MVPSGQETQRQSLALSQCEMSQLRDPVYSTLVLKPGHARAAGTWDRVGGASQVPHLEEQWVLADPLDWGQQVAFQWNVRGLPASQQHTALQSNRDLC